MFTPEPKPPHPSTLARTPEGGYTEAIGNNLMAAERHAIRGALAKGEPLRLSEIAEKSGVSLFSVAHQEALRRFVQEELVKTLEVREHHEPDKHGQPKFKGRWIVTDHGKSLYQKGLS